MTPSERMILENQRVIMSALRHLMASTHNLPTLDYIGAVNGRIAETEKHLAARGPAAGMTTPPEAPAPTGHFSRGDRVRHKEHGITGTVEFVYLPGTTIEQVGVHWDKTHGVGMRTPYENLEKIIPGPAPWTNASDEPLPVIEANECSHDPASLVTRRFRRLFNELHALKGRAV